MSNCKNMKMRKYITPSVEMLEIEPARLMLDASFVTHKHGGDQSRGRAPKRSDASPF